MKRVALSPRQLFWTAFLMMFPTILLLLPGDLLRLGGRYAWWTPLVAAVPAMMVVWGAGSLARRHGSLGAVALDRLGPVAGRIPLVVIGAALGAYTVVITREFAQVALATYVFESVPVSVLTVLGLIVAGLAAWLGMTVIARGAEVVAPTMIWVYLALVAASLPFSHVSWALPLIPRNAHFAALQPLGRTWVWLAEPVSLTLLLDRVDEPARRSGGRLLAGAVGAAALLTAVVLWAIVADFGPPRAAEFVLPFFNLSKEITLGSFLEHLEVVLIPIILMGGTGKLAIFYWLWADTGERLTAGGRDAWLLSGLIGLGAVSVAAFSNAVALDQALYWLLAQRALPVLLGAVAVTYGIATLRPGGARR